MSQFLLYSNSGKNVHLVYIYRVVSIWVVCFVFTGKMLSMLHWMLFWVVKLTFEAPFHCENPPDSDSFSLPVLTFPFQSLFSPLWLHLTHPDSWFCLVLSLADLTFWSHGPKSSKGTWAEWLWAVKNSSSLLRMELGACREDALFYLPDWRASCHRVEAHPRRPETAL